MRHASLLMIVLTLFLVVSFTAQAAAEEVRFITIASGPVGGEWYILGGILGELIREALPEVRVTSSTGGAVANLTTVNRGRADLGTTQDQLLYEALQGGGPFAELEPHDNVTGLTYLADIYMSVFLVREEFELRSIAEIAEREVPIRLLTAPRGSSPSVAAERMLETYGITVEDIQEYGGLVNYVSYSEAASLIRDGHADAYVGPIMPAIVELSVARPLRLLPVEDWVLSELSEQYKYGISTIPAELYPFVVEDTPVMTESPILIVRADLPEDIVYAITRAIHTHPERIRESGRTYQNFTPENGPRISGGPIHPGAKRYYHEQGWLEE